MNNTMTIREVIDALNQAKDKSQLCYVWIPDGVMAFNDDRYPISSVDTSMDKHVDINIKEWDLVGCKELNTKYDTLEMKMKYLKAASKQKETQMYVLEEELERLSILEKRYETDFTKLADIDISCIDILYTEKDSDEIKIEQFYGLFNIKTDEQGHMLDIQQYSEPMWNDGFSWREDLQTYVWTSCAGGFREINIVGYANMRED